MNQADVSNLRNAAAVFLNEKAPLVEVIDLKDGAYFEFSDQLGTFVNAKGTKYNVRITIESE